MEKPEELVTLGLAVEDAASEVVIVTVLELFAVM